MCELVTKYTLPISDLEGKQAGQEHWLGDSASWISVKARGASGEPGLRQALAVPLASSVARPPQHAIAGPPGPQ
eukprot:15311383-Alexandrium_andersonii.AAC.1